MAAADAQIDTQGDAPVDARVLARLSAVVESRRGGDPDASYTARLLAGGTAGIARKVGEEAVETVVAALSGDRAGAVEESADLLFHLTVLWADAGIAPEEVFAALARREGVSGLDEKRARTARGKR